MGLYRIIPLALNAVGLLLTGLLAAPLGNAAGPCPHHFGSNQQVSDASGGAQEWTIFDVKKSTAVLPGYTASGQIWEAEATVRAAEGTITPLIPNLQARSTELRYPVLWQVATEQGLAAATLTQGETASGIVYFDITGPDPMGVVYTTGPTPTMMWCCGGAMSMPMSAQMKASMDAMMES
ncbi:DUF1942 domain-containing protein [Mycobacteroides salmoniphilum]|uniref:DUF1942 domain-containing protein n=1 Tax=Mycobacteroides salmoniphilum TaxID=404941 RepID=UPI0009931BCE|nr:DUF1942 domain-containing protein [Mycobacteroides salmoniphilum]